MTTQEHEQMQHLEGLVKRYRRRIIELKHALGVLSPEARRQLEDEAEDVALRAYDEAEAWRHPREKW